MALITDYSRKPLATAGLRQTPILGGSTHPKCKVFQWGGCTTPWPDYTVDPDTQKYRLSVAEFTGLPGQPGPMLMIGLFIAQGLAQPCVGAGLPAIGLRSRPVRYQTLTIRGRYAPQSRASPLLKGKINCGGYANAFSVAAISCNTANSPLSPQYRAINCGPASTL
ncbi:hypothetical protein D9M71_415900 [compost metagenome]